MCLCVCGRFELRSRSSVFPWPPRNRLHHLRSSDWQSSIKTHLRNLVFVRRSRGTKEETTYEHSADAKSLTWKWNFHKNKSVTCERQNTPWGLYAICPLAATRPNPQRGRFALSKARFDKKASLVFKENCWQKRIKCLYFIIGRHFEKHGRFEKPTPDSSFSY